MDCLIFEFLSNEECIDIPNYFALILEMIAPLNFLENMIIFLWYYAIRKKGSN